ncbi:hypothetical protein V6N12_017850 [Hibiscus sabdariffa]|uniref:Uncharacterized protein n=1 Tax=Hibiscus sabdariffa TaxID=183260 RepID=A0ABR2B0M0_9ROSI
MKIEETLGGLSCSTSRSIVASAYSIQYLVLSTEVLILLGLIVGLSNVAEVFFLITDSESLSTCINRKPKSITKIIALSTAFAMKASATLGCG